MYSTGPEAEVGFPGSVETWKGDEWKRGGGTTWGWYSYDPELDLFYYGTGNPGSWNPDQRPGDNKYSMTIFARNPDTGKAAWAYQKTPHDAWDYDGINENVLADLNINGQTRKVLVNFDRNGFAYVLDRKTGELLQADPFVHVNWANEHRPQDRQADRGPREAHVGDEEHQGHLPVGDGRQEPAAGVVLAADRLLLRADQQPVHGLRGRRGEVPGRPAVRRRDRRQQGRARAATAASSSRGIRSPARRCGASRRTSRRGAARSRPPATWCSTARWKAGSRRSTPRPATCCGSSRRRRASSATR